MKNNYDKLFLPLNSQEDTLQETRALFVMFLKEELSKIKLNLELSVDIAYSIAGLAATDFARELPDDDPIEEIITIAGELEINPDNAGALRSELIQKIELL